MKLITKAIAPKLIAAYEHSAETGEGGKDVLAKFFTPWGNATWYITEGWPCISGEALPKETAEAMLKTGGDPDAYDWHLFGFCDLGDVYCAELGYVMLSDLKGLKGPFGLRVERDLHYTAELTDILAKYEKARAA